MSRRPSVMPGSHNFATVPSASIPRSSFDRSHGYKTTMNSGYLVPIFIDEVLPGDTMHLNMNGFCRMATPLKPIMDNAYFNTFFFFVPNRLLWDHWQQFNGQQDDPGASTDYVVPQVVSAAGEGAQSLSDYFGMPVGKPFTACAFFHRAYNLIWNEWFRDENLQNRAPQVRTDGPDNASDYPLKRRGKRHDYFTSCLPWPQKGPSIGIPLGASAPVVPVTGVGPSFQISNNGSLHVSKLNWSPGGGSAVLWDSASTVTGGPAIWGSTDLKADLTSATAATINQLRQAFQIQRLYERDARGGTRYTEVIRSHFGVVSPDARLQRPEYLGGGQSPVLVSQVAQTQGSGGGATTPQGNLAAFGTASLQGHGFSKSFTEHGVIIGLVSVRADLNYQQGLQRMFSRKTRFDFYWPALAHIGEQAVLSKEIYYNNDGAAGDETVFGYQERFAEYRYFPSQITGKLRSTDPQTLDIWHLAQKFDTRPTLSATFIVDNPPFERVVAVPSEPQFIADFFFNYRCARPMPVYGVPGLIDHF